MDCNFNGYYMKSRFLATFSRIFNKLNRLWFDFCCRGVYKTPPVKCNPSSKVVVVSQLYHPDLTMYMLAAKSLARYISPCAFVIVDDGLLPRDKQILSGHFEPIRFIPSQDVELSECPKGGTWERLLTLSKENRDNYVIQLDADILVLNELSEVQESIDQDRTFTLGTKTGQHLIDLSEASCAAHSKKNNHVQNYAECALGQYPGKDNLKYVRGCSGFTGFARGQLPLKEIEEFSVQMEKLIGKDKWHEWGSEQVTSNFMAANAEKSLVLSVDRYPFWGRDVDVSQAVLVHFFGTFRYYEGMYLKQSQRILKNLLGKAHD